MDFQRVFKNKWLIAIGIIGVLLLVISSIGARKNSTETIAPASAFSTNTTPSGPTSTTTNTGDSLIANAQALENSYDAQLESILSKIAGIHAVTVMVTVNDSGSVTVAKNDTRTNTVTGSGSNASQTSSESDQIYSGSSENGGPYVLSSSLPHVMGVLVTVRADDFIVAKAEIIESITNVLDVPAYKISVEPQKGN